VTLDSVLETALRRDRRIALAMLSAVVVFAWAYLLAGAGMDISGGDMTRMADSVGLPSMTEMQMPSSGDAGISAVSGMEVTAAASWSLGYAAIIFLMWWVMMVAMMLPSAAPMILLFAAINRKQRLQGSPQVPTGLFMLSYLVVWGGFSLVAAALQWRLSGTGLLGSGMALGSATLAGILLVAAGLYQLTPLKQACLRQCQSPVHFLTTHWRSGAAGAWRMGMVHGFYCVGCCWFLMLLLFFGGVMNLFWIAGLALFVLFEKAVPADHWLSYAAGLGLTAWGAWLIAGTI
jgi:predicted metal-binding membrane protein